MDLDARHGRGQDASRAGPCNGETSRIVGGKQRAADTRAQGGNGARRYLRVELHFIKEAARGKVAEEKAEDRRADHQQDS